MDQKISSRIHVEMMFGVAAREATKTVAWAMYEEAQAAGWSVPAQELLVDDIIRVGVGIAKNG